MNQYATLSYCWGKQSFIRLQKQNLSDFKQGIDIALLPKTFKHFIEAARRLGIGYIWIDALCIIQDSPEDWAREAVMMCKVYSYSTLTLAAAASENSNGGLFYERDPLLLNGVKLPVTWTNDRLGSFQGIYHCIRLDSWKSSVLGSPLLERAWVFQERLLSPRTVYFASDQLYWECGSLYASEVSPTGGPWDLAFRERFFHTAKRLPDELLPSYDGRFKHNYFAAMSQGSDKTDMPFSEKIPYLWANIISQYSSGQLTFEKDRLVAISGVAKAISGFLRNDEYYAGHWLSNLALSLLWKAEDEEYGRMKNYQAPSWSWASIPGAVDMSLVFRSREKPNITIEVLKVDVVPADIGERTGSVIGSSIQVKGLLCKAHHSVRLKRNLTGPFAMNFYDRVRLRKTCTYSLLPYETESCLIFRKKGFTTCYPSEFPFDEKPKKETEIYCLQVATGIVKHPWGELGFVAGLMLTPTGVKGQFSRIGYFELVPEEMRRSWRASVGMGRRLLDGDRKTLESELFRNSDIGSSHYESRDGDYYTISII